MRRPFLAAVAVLSVALASLAVYGWSTEALSTVRFVTLSSMLVSMILLWSASHFSGLLPEAMGWVFWLPQCVSAAISALAAVKLYVYISSVESDFLDILSSLGAAVFFAASALYAARAACVRRWARFELAAACERLFGLEQLDRIQASYQEIKGADTCATTSTAASDEALLRRVKVWEFVEWLERRGLMDDMRRRVRARERLG